MTATKIPAADDPHINYQCAHCGEWGMVRTSLFRKEMLCVGCTESGVKGVKAPINHRIGIGEFNVTKVQDNILGASKMEKTAEASETEVLQEEPKAKKTNGVHAAPTSQPIHPSASDLEAHSAVVSRLRARLEQIPKERSDKCAALDAEEAEILRELGEKPRRKLRVTGPASLPYDGENLTPRAPAPKEPKAKSNTGKSAKPAKASKKASTQTSESQKAISNFLSGGKWAKVGVIAEGTGIDSLIVKRDLDVLREAGRLKKRGQARAMEYALK